MYQSIFQNIIQQSKGIIWNYISVESFNFSNLHDKNGVKYSYSLVTKKINIIHRYLCFVYNRPFRFAKQQQKIILKSRVNKFE